MEAVYRKKRAILFTYGDEGGRREERKHTGRGWERKGGGNEGEIEGARRKGWEGTATGGGRGRMVGKAVCWKSDRRTRRKH
jgi:hypothetical protein